MRNLWNCWPRCPKASNSFVAQYHTTTGQLAELANKAKPKRLVTYHTISVPPAIAPPRLLSPKAGADALYALYASPDMLQKEIGSRYSGRFVIGKDSTCFRGKDICTPELPPHYSSD
jgi:ribonuclease BN (tRNA processing enzyme)